MRFREILEKAPASDEHVARRAAADKNLVHTIVSAQDKSLHVLECLHLNTVRTAPIAFRPGR